MRADTVDVRAACRIDRPVAKWNPPFARTSRGGISQTVASVMTAFQKRPGC